MGGPLAWGLGVGLTTPYRKKYIYCGNVKKILGLGQILSINDRCY
jgi:hypothetical protein